MQIPIDVSVIDCTMLCSSNLDSTLRVDVIQRVLEWYLYWSCLDSMELTKQLFEEFSKFRPQTKSVTQHLMEVECLESKS